MSLQHQVCFVLFLFFVLFLQFSVCVEILRFESELVKDTLDQLEQQV
jgi:hypothetical protein